MKKVEEIKGFGCPKFGQFETFSLNMQTFFFLALAFGCALAAQPYVWYNGTCPEDKETHESYIILGEDAPKGKYPYMLSLNSEAADRHSCGASILTKNWALTAAHCCDGMKGKKFYLKAGTNSLTKGGSIHKIDEFIIHENYNPYDYWKNDICVIKVANPFVFGPKVQKITLPPQNMPVNDGDLLTITGWGYTKPDVNVCPDKMQLGKNFVALSAAKCASITGHNHESYLCALGGKKGQGVCNGDSGSPLVKNGVQVGITSWVYLPCGCGQPDFYARVPLFINWIKQKLGSEASELKF